MSVSNRRTRNHRALALRAAFKGRLLQKIRQVWGSTRAAIEAGVATKVLYHWLDPNHQALPSADDLAEICERGGISAEWLLFGEGPENRGETWPRRNLEGELASVVKTELLKRGADDITVRSLTPPVILNSAIEALYREVNVWAEFEDSFATVLSLLPLSEKERASRGVSIRDVHQVQFVLLRGAEAQAPILAAFKRKSLHLSHSAPASAAARGEKKSQPARAKSKESKRKPSTRRKT